MHRSSDSRRYREGDTFESVGEFEARGGLQQHHSSSAYDEFEHRLRWKDGNGFGTRGSSGGRRLTFKRAVLIAVTICVGVAVVSKARGGSRGASLLPSRAQHLLEMLETDIEEEDELIACDPYSLHGILITNWTEPSENRWAPIAAPAACQPVDWISLIRSAQLEGTWYPQLDWAKNRTIAIFGDSIDRDHNEHTCQFVGGELERINEGSPFSPDYPPGQEVPPATYRNAFSGKREWTPDYDQSRPYVCHIQALNLRIVSVFHFGFQSISDWLLNYYHPPTTAIERFDSIFVPLLENLGDAYDTSRIPDVVTFSTGFWDLLHHSIIDDVERDELVRQGVDGGEANYIKDTYRVMPVERRSWFEHQVRDLLLHVAEAWPEGKGHKPRLVLRALHHPQANHLVPITSVQALDSITRSIVGHLQEEGRAAQKGEKAWKRWVHKSQTLMSQEPVVNEDEGRTWHDALKQGLGSRLVVDEWGTMILGQELRQRDHLHPHPLPSNYLYANMLMEQLKKAVEAEAVWKEAQGVRGKS
ncbi:hypothetical protein T439DRAFT_321902 [Meredithblackwellia eburnea MCA 4105]